MRYDIIVYLSLTDTTSYLGDHDPPGGYPQIEKRYII